MTSFFLYGWYTKKAWNMQKILTFTENCCGKLFCSQTNISKIFVKIQVLIFIELSKNIFIDWFEYNLYSFTFYQFLRRQKPNRMVIILIQTNLLNLFVETETADSRIYLCVLFVLKIKNKKKIVLYYKNLFSIPLYVS